jgi:hypothetical protein
VARDGARRCAAPDGVWGDHGRRRRLGTGRRRLLGRLPCACGMALVASERELCVPGKGRAIEVGAVTADARSARAVKRRWCAPMARDAPGLLVRTRECPEGVIEARRVPRLAPVTNRACRRLGPGVHRALRRYVFGHVARRAPIRVVVWPGSRAGGRRARGRCRGGDQERGADGAVDPHVRIVPAGSAFPGGRTPREPSFLTRGGRRRRRRPVRRAVSPPPPGGRPSRGRPRASWFAAR